MLRTGVLNPRLSALLCRFRHTNTIVIADRGFPYWPQLEIVDLSLVDDIPTVADVLRAVTGACQIGAAWMADEFRLNNTPETIECAISLMSGVAIGFEPHIDFKKRVPFAIGLIRTGDTTPYANIILESA